MVTPTIHPCDTRLLHFAGVTRPGEYSLARPPSTGFRWFGWAPRSVAGDAGVHLWDQRDNPVFWLSDRTVVRDMLGDYDSLPGRYTLPDYRRETLGYDVRGVIWSDAGAADPLAAAGWVSQQQDGTPPVIAMVTLGDPASAAFPNLVDRCRQWPLIRSIRMRLVPELSGRPTGRDLLDDRLVRDNLALLASGVSH